MGMLFITERGKPKGFGEVMLLVSHVVWLTRPRKSPRVIQRLVRCPHYHFSLLPYRISKRFLVRSWPFLVLRDRGENVIGHDQLVGGARHRDIKKACFHPAMLPSFDGTPSPGMHTIGYSSPLLLCIVMSLTLLWLGEYECLLSCCH
jgi:hypothetical protein